MKRLSLVVLFALAVTILMAAPSAWSQERMKSGQWETTSTGHGQSHSHTSCLTPEQAKDVNGTPAEMRAYVEKTTTAAKCTVQNYKTEGNTVSYRMSCIGSVTDTSTTYHGDSFEMVMTTKAASGEAEVSGVKARRLGACP